jgi:hypothetical protein
MNSNSERADALVRQGLKVQFATSVQGDLYQVTGKDGTVYSLRPQHLKHLDEEGKLTWSGIKELSARIEAQNVNAQIKR